MKIYIELLIIVIIGLMLLLWFIYLKISQFIYVRRYKPENDKGYQGNKRRQELLKEGRPDPIKRIAEAINGEGERNTINEGQGEFEGHSDLQTTKTDSDGETSKSNGKVSKPRRFRNPFRRK